MTRITSLRLIVLATVATVASIGLAAPAQAASLGTLTIAPTSGDVTTNPMFTSATTPAACPATFGQNVALKIGRNGVFNNLRAVTSGGGFDTRAFALAPNRSFTAANNNVAPGDGEWTITIECGSRTEGMHPDVFDATIVVTGSSWRVKGSSSEPAATATTLAASASTVTAGDEVTFTATVAPAAAAGTVRFADGGATLDTVAVSNGTATYKTSSLAAGSHAVTAAFTPADTTLFQASSSEATTVTVTAAGGVSDEQQITAQVVGGSLTLAVAGDSVALTGGTVGGQATGAMQKATVTDARGTNTGWNLTGQVSNFTGTPAGTIAAAQLGWTPNATKVSGPGAVTAGANATPGSGLSSAKTLCSAATGASTGVFDCTAGLTLGIPTSTAPGSYTGTLTLTLS